MNSSKNHKRNVIIYTAIFFFVLTLLTCLVSLWSVKPCSKKVEVDHIESFYRRNVLLHTYRMKDGTFVETDHLLDGNKYCMDSISK